MGRLHRSSARFATLGTLTAVLVAEPCPARQPPTAPESKPGEFVAEAIPADLQAVLDSKAQLPGTSDVKNVPPDQKAIVQDTRKLWPVGYAIKISFLGGTPEARKKIARYAAGWTEAGANLKFDFGQTGPDSDCRIYRRGDRSQVRISFSRPGYFSLIGTDCLSVPEPMETMNFHQFDINPPDETMVKTIVLHEFGHLIGLSHEHQHHRVDCDWNWSVLYRELAGPPNNWSRQQIDFNMKQINYLTNPRITATPHDRKSIMHYSFPARYFNHADSPCHIPQNVELSETDKAAAKTLYPMQGARSLEQMNALAAARDLAPAEVKEGIEARLRLFREPTNDSERTDGPPKTTDASPPPARGATTPAAGPAARTIKKLALLVGVNDCPAATPLKGAVNDALAMKKLLTTKFEFAPENVVTLLNKDATHAAIVDAFRDHLIAKADKDSVVVFHFSGHGDQVLDEPDGDEVDGLDETLVPYDGDLNGRGHIKDDELKTLFGALTAKTKNVTFVMDCCHSGTNVRAIAAARRIPHTDAELRERDGKVARLLQARRASGQGPTAARVDAEVRDYALIAGCRSDQLSYEMFDEERRQPCGALTRCFVLEVERAPPGATYRDVMDKVKGEVARRRPGQEPQLEGVGLDHVIFSDQTSVADSFIRTDPSGADVTLHAGAVHGVTAGSIYDVHPPGTKQFDPTKALGRVTIVDVNAEASRAVKQGAFTVPNAARAVLRTYNHPATKIGVFFDDAASGVLTAVRQAFEGDSRPINPQEIHAAGRDKPTTYKDAFEIVDDPSKAVLVVRQESAVDPQGRPLGPPDRITLSTPDGAILSTTLLANNPNAVDDVLKDFARWGKWFNVLGVENGDAKNRLGVGFSVRIPQGAKALKIPGAVDLTLKDGDEIEFVVTNPNDVDVYFTILDFSTDGSISLVYPPIGENSPLPARKPWTHKTTVSAGPNGAKSRDYLKLIATPKPVDFSFLTQGGLPSKGASDPLVKLLTTKQFNQRGVNPIPVETAGWTTETVVVDVLPK